MAGGSTPKPPDPVAPAPTPEDPSVQKAKTAQRIALARKRGFSSAILVGESAALSTPASYASKGTLGA